VVAVLVILVVLPQKGFERVLFLADLCAWIIELHKIGEECLELADLFCQQEAIISRLPYLVVQRVGKSWSELESSRKARFDAPLLGLFAWSATAPFFSCWLLPLLSHESPSLLCCEQVYTILHTTTREENGRCFCCEHVIYTLLTTTHTNRFHCVRFIGILLTTLIARHFPFIHHLLGGLHNPPSFVNLLSRLIFLCKRYDDLNGRHKMPVKEVLLGSL